MLSSSLVPFLILALVATTVNGQAVFAHVIVGNNQAYTLSNWISDIRLASSFDIDGFVLNIAPPLLGAISTQLDHAFRAAAEVGNTFKLFLSFDYLGGDGSWSTEDIVGLLKQYCTDSAYYHHDGRPMVSTFEGPTNSNVSQWVTIRQSIDKGIYFVPTWTSQGPGYRTDLYDGACSWDMWPNGPDDMTTAPDEAWQRSLKEAGKTYMMGVSPWFYTNLPRYHKAWVWRGDRLWYDRWQQVIQRCPDFVQIVSWNDFGECHYIGPIFEQGIPQSMDADARPYVCGFPHEAWLETLPYQIAAYKHAIRESSPAPMVRTEEDKVVFWYRITPVSAGKTRATGNHGPSAINAGAYQKSFTVADMLEDCIFAIALLSEPGEVSIAIGKSPTYTFEGPSAGINFVHRPFYGQVGNITVTSSSGCYGEGRPIQEKPDDGVANYNAWVGCARQSKPRTASPIGSVNAGSHSCSSRAR